MKIRPRLAFVAVAALSFNATAQTTDSTNVKTGHPVLEAIESELGIKMEPLTDVTVPNSLGYFYGGTNDDDSRFLIAAFNDVDKNRRLTPADDFSFLQLVKDTFIVHVRKFSEEDYRESYRNNEIKENERYVYGNAEIVTYFQNETMITPLPGAIVHKDPKELIRYFAANPLVQGLGR
jgi:hypothetical protein